VAAVQGEPLALVPHDMLLHVAGALHWLLPLQVVRQATLLASQRNGSQVTEFGVTQWPAPSHLEAPVALFVAGLQLPEVQTLLSHSWQAPWPSQVPSRMQVDCGSGPQSAWPACGMVPAGMSVQVPGVPGRLQAWQAPSHLESP